LITGFLLLLPSLMVGMVTGFLLLDERDDRILTTVAVTPIGRSGYIKYRMLVTAALGLIYAAAVFPMINFMGVALRLVAPIALVAAMEVPITALFLATFAGNKVEGLALSKGLGIFMIAPVIAYFTECRWETLLGVIPFFWPVTA